MAEDKKTGDMAKPTPEESRDDREQELSTESEQVSKEKVEERLATEELDDFVETEVPVSFLPDEVRSHTIGKGLKLLRGQFCIFPSTPAFHLRKNWSR